MNCVQGVLPEGATLIPILLASDETHLNNLSGDEKLCPVYISIGNIRSAIRTTPAMQPWIPIAFLLIRPKPVNRIPGYSVESQEIQALQTVHDVLAHLLKPLSDAKYETGYEMVCADENVRLCFPKLFCWLANHVENATINCMSSNRCPVCTIPTEKLVEDVVTSYPIGSHEGYARAYRQSDAAGLNAYSIKNINNALWSIAGLNPPDSVWVDILHNILLRMLDHLMSLIQGFL